MEGNTIVSAWNNECLETYVEGFGDEDIRYVTSQPCDPTDILQQWIITTNETSHAIETPYGIEEIDVTYYKYSPAYEEYAHLYIDHNSIPYSDVSLEVGADAIDQQFGHFPCDIDIPPPNSELPTLPPAKYPSSPCFTIAAVELLPTSSDEVVKILVGNYGSKDSTPPIFHDAKPICVYQN